ncbi:MAG: serine hydrolase domain-containing protein [Hyphomonadaceae bacterium]
MDRRFIALAAALACAACASTPEAARIDDAAREHMAAANVTGLGIAIVEGGEVRLARAYGHADAARGLELSPDSIMHAASLTKPAFAYMVLQLADEGLLDLDQPIAELLPRPLPTYARYADLADDERWRLLTPRMLLSHTSGLPNWRRFTESGRIQFFYQPGAHYNYSGEGLQILQLTLEQGLGLDVAAEMQRRVFDRFGMTQTSMIWRDAFAPLAAIGHDADGAPAPPLRFDRPMAAGSMSTSLADYARFVAGILRGDGLSEGAHAEMLRTQINIDSVRQFPAPPPNLDTDWRTSAWEAIGLGYGLGWGVYEGSRGRAFFKEGNDDGWSHVTLAFAEDQAALVLMSNSNNAQGVFAYLIEDLAGEACLPWFWMGYTPHDRPQFAPPSALADAPPPCTPLRP